MATTQLVVKMNKVTVTFSCMLVKKQIVSFPSKPIMPGKPKSECIYIFCPCRIPAEADIRMAQCPICKEWYHSRRVNICLMQYLETQIVTGNALCVSKDELNRQGYTYVYNACMVWCVVCVCCSQITQLNFHCTIYKRTVHSTIHCLRNNL